MKCPKCGVKAQDDCTYIFECGSDLHNGKVRQTRECLANELEAKFAQLNKLFGNRSWKLERISPTTYVKDVVQWRELSAVKVAEASKLIREGKCYRCKIGTGKWHFGTSIEEAIENALK